MQAKPIDGDVIVLGAGAAGMMCAIEAGRRGRRVHVIDHAKAPGEKIRISGGGRCNFTNLHCGPANFLSRNPHFPISALRRYTQHDFIARVSRAGIPYHEKTLGQLFCDGSAREIISMLVADMKQAGVKLHLNTTIEKVERQGQGFAVSTPQGLFTGRSLVVATGGKSIPKMGATGIGYEIAGQFGLDLVPTRAGLVPFTLTPEEIERNRPLAGVSLHVRASCGGTAFEEGMIFTHRGLSGPAILQISSYWQDGEEVEINLAPASDPLERLLAARRERPRQSPAAILSDIVPKSLAARLAEEAGIKRERAADLSNQDIDALARLLTALRIRPNGTEGYRTAEVTLGGVDTAGLSQKTMEAKHQPGLYFIGEVVDVTGHLGGHNFQWAWSSGWAAGQYA